jgi:hypothetical protein
MLPIEKSLSKSSQRLRRDSFRLKPLTQRLENVKSEYEYLDFDRVQYERREQQLDSKFNARKQRLVSISS